MYTKRQHIIASLYMLFNWLLHIISKTLHAALEIQFFICHCWKIIFELAFTWTLIIWKIKRRSCRPNKTFSTTTAEPDHQVEQRDGRIGL